MRINIVVFLPSIANLNGRGNLQSVNRNLSHETVPLIIKTAVTFLAARRPRLGGHMTASSWVKLNLLENDEGGGWLWLRPAAGAVGSLAPATAASISLSVKVAKGI